MSCRDRFHDRYTRPVWAGTDLMTGIPDTVTVSQKYQDRYGTRPVPVTVSEVYRDRYGSKPVTVTGLRPVTVTVFKV